MKVFDLISLRFVALISHLILLIAHLWNQDGSRRNCLRWDYNDAQYKPKAVELTVALSLSIVSTFIEMVTFMIGITMFYPMQCLFSLTAHGTGAFILFYYIMQFWDCSLSWWIFFLTILAPLLSEMIIVVRTLLFKMI